MEEEERIKGMVGESRGGDEGAQDLASVSYGGGGGMAVDVADLSVEIKKMRKLRCQVK